MFFETTIIFVLLGFSVLSGTELTENSDNTEVSTSDHLTSQTVSNHLNAAKELFKSNYEQRHNVIIDNIKVEMKPETFAGSYFTSGILLLTFSFKQGDSTVSSSALLKVPEMGPMFKNGLEMLFYPKERFMYEKVIPLMYENVPYEKLSPNFYGGTESGILILEDMRVSGYRGLPKGSLVKWLECEIVWKSLARFHALSTRPLDKVTELLDSLTVMDRCKGRWVTEVFPPLAEKLREHVIPLCSEGTNTFLNHFLVDFCPLYINPAFSPSKVGRNVILHGDAHLSNILFKYGPNDDEIECKFVDFQMSRRGSPVIDLMYFSIISVHYEVFDQNRDTLFKLYVQEFNSTLENIGASKDNVYTLEELKADWETHRNFFFFVLIGVAPPLWVGNHKTSGLNGEESTIDHLFKSESYRSAFKGWIKHLLPAQEFGGP